MKRFDIVLKCSDETTLMHHVQAIRFRHSVEARTAQAKGIKVEYEEIKEAPDTIRFVIKGTPSYIQDKYEQTIKANNSRKNKFLLRRAGVQIIVEKASKDIL